MSPIHCPKAGSTPEVNASITYESMRSYEELQVLALFPTWPGPALPGSSDLQTHSNSMQFPTSASQSPEYRGFVKSLYDSVTLKSPRLQSKCLTVELSVLCHQGFGHQLTPFSSSAFNQTHMVKKSEKNPLAAISTGLCDFCPTNSHSDVL